MEEADQRRGKVTISGSVQEIYRHGTEGHGGDVYMVGLDLRSFFQTFVILFHGKQYWKKNYN